jgi:2,5-dioxopentanoate dehydrogenase
MTDTIYKDATPGEIEATMQASFAAFKTYRNLPVAQRALFLESIATEIEALGEVLIETASGETNLPAARLIGERGRTTMQLRMFATMVREGRWQEAIIETAIPDKTPAKPDIRRMLLPMGPVVVFGASNFPFAYSTAGGDTASALAAGCSVVVKAHPAHPHTSEIVYGAIRKAALATGMPADICLHIQGASFETGKALVQHPLTRAVGFTGSFKGGKALYDYAQERTHPIPVFAEMGSTNPVVFFPGTLALNEDTLAKQYAASITLGVGQFCTKPGILLAIEGTAFDQFTQLLAAAMGAVTPAKMLHAGIHKAYYSNLELAATQPAVSILEGISNTNGDLEAQPVLALTTGKELLARPQLQEEIFGPYALLVACSDAAELKAVWESLAGQLTTSLMGTDEDFKNFSDFIEAAPDIAGRIVFNGVPTGVEVGAAMVHGGPYPATTDSRYSAVGIHAVKRWARPVCYQNCPEWLLPEALKQP